LSYFDFRRLTLYLTFASVGAVLCSNSASNWLIAAAVALLAGHFRCGGALQLAAGETAARPVLSGHPDRPRAFRTHSRRLDGTP
jgi:hypothetical protein